MGLLSNVYISDTYRYKVAEAAATYFVGGGVHYWYVAPAGTAGAPVTLNEALRISNSGDVTVGNIEGGCRFEMRLPVPAG